MCEEDSIAKRIRGHWKREPILIYDSCITGAGKRKCEKLLVGECSGVELYMLYGDKKAGRILSCSELAERQGPKRYLNNPDV